jgi:hypothetical protein
MNYYIPLAPAPQLEKYKKRDMLVENKSAYC